MKTNLLKNILLVGSGIAIATSTAIFATSQQGTSIQANLVSLVQYLNELHITSDGTPDGNPVMHIDGSGNFAQIRQEGDPQYGILNDSTTLGMPYVGSMAGSGDDGHLVGIENIPGLGLLSVVAAMGNESEWVNYLGVSNRGIGISHIGEVGSGDSDNSIFVDADGIQFSFIGANKEYRFPTDAGQANQVLTTDGAGQLSWADVSAPSQTNNVITQKISLSSGDILSLGSSPVKVIDAPGVGKTIQLMSVLIRYNVGTTPYTSTNKFYLADTNADVYMVSHASIGDISGNNDGIMTTMENELTGIDQHHENTDMYIGVTSSSNPTGGDGSFDVYITYTIIDL